MTDAIIVLVVVAAAAAALVFARRRSHGGCSGCSQAGCPGRSQGRCPAASLQVDALERAAAQASKDDVATEPDEPQD